MTKDETEQEYRLAVPVSELEDDLCRVMWLSVIMQALSDALSGSDKYPFKQRREEALEWFAAREGSGSEFATVCDLAGVDFEMAKERIGKFISGELNAIDFRCFRKGNFDTPATENRKRFFKRTREKELRGRIRRPSSIISPETFRKPPIISKAANDAIAMTNGAAA